MNPQFLAFLTKFQADSVNLQSYVRNLPPMQGGNNQQSIFGGNPFNNQQNGRVDSFGFTKRNGVVQKQEYDLNQIDQETKAQVRTGLVDAGKVNAAVVQYNKDKKLEPGKDGYIPTMPTDAVKREGNNVTLNQTSIADWRSQLSNNDIHSKIQGYLDNDKDNKYEKAGNDFANKAGFTNLPAHS